MKMLEQRITSVELCRIINELRKEEKGENAKELLHYDFMKKIRKEVETMKKLGLTGDGNFSLSSYINSQNKEQPCYSLNASGMRQMLNSESTYVRYKTEEYIKKLENENEKLKSQPPQLTKEQELALKIFNGGFTAIEAYKELADIETKPLKKTIKDQEETIIDLTKKNNYLNLITDSSNTYSTREVAKHLGLKSERQLYKILINCKVIFKTKNGGYLLSGALENEGFNKYVTVVKKGEVVATQLKWTETGKLFIYDLLKEMEII